MIGNFFVKEETEGRSPSQGLAMARRVYYPLWARFYRELEQMTGDALTEAQREADRNLGSTATRMEKRKELERIAQEKLREVDKIAETKWKGYYVKELVSAGERYKVQINQQSVSALPPYNPQNPDYSDNDPGGKRNRRQPDGPAGGGGNGNRNNRSSGYRMSPEAKNVALGITGAVVAGAGALWAAKAAKDQQTDAEQPFQPPEEHKKKLGFSKVLYTGAIILGIAGLGFIANAATRGKLFDRIRHH